MNGTKGSRMIVVNLMSIEDIHIVNLEIMVGVIKDTRGIGVEDVLILLKTGDVLPVSIIGEDHILQKIVTASIEDIRTRSNGVIPWKRIRPGNNMRVTTITTGI